MREPSNRRKSSRTLQRSGHTKSKMIVLNAVHRFRVWSVHLSAPWRARQGGAGIQLCPPTIVVFNSFFNGCEIQNSHCMPWRYCLELFFSLYAFARDSRQSRVFTQSVSQSILEEKLGKKDSHRHFPMQLEIIGHLHRKWLYFFTWNHPPALRMEPPPRTIMQTAVTTVTYK